LIENKRDNPFRPQGGRWATQGPRNGHRRAGHRISDGLSAEPCPDAPVGASLAYVVKDLPAIRLGGPVFVLKDADGTAKP